MLRLVISSLKMYILWRIGVLYLCQCRQNVQFFISPQKLVSLENTDSKHVKFWCNPETRGENQYQSGFAAWGKLYTGFDFKRGNMLGVHLPIGRKTYNGSVFQVRKIMCGGGGRVFVTTPIMNILRYAVLNNTAARLSKTDHYYS